jgi:hypothetical protein
MMDLDNMGSLHDVKRPDFLTDENHDISNNEIQYALKDLYHSLLFDGEAPEHKSTVMPELEYDDLEKGLIENVYRIQHTTVGRALKRVMKNVECKETKEKQNQSTFEPFQLEISKMKEIAEELYQDKYKLKQEGEGYRIENVKLKHQIENKISQKCDCQRKFSVNLGEQVKRAPNDNSQINELNREIMEINKNMTEQHKKILAYKDALK